MSIIIETATWEDIQNLCRFWKELHDEAVPKAEIRKDYDNPEVIFYEMAYRVKAPEWTVFVARDDETLDNSMVGFIMGWLHKPKYNPTYLIGTGDAIYVRPEWRGKGIDRRLIDALDIKQKSQGAVAVEFMSCYDDRLMKYYDKQGFEPVQIIYRRKREV